jgi:SOS response regulatory protein OraA/RecX
MKLNLFKSRRGKLKAKLENKLLNKVITEKDINDVITFVDEYEKANLATIEKLKRNKTVDLNKINGALKQTINAHGPITKDFIGSASKRIYGSLLDSEKPKKKFYFLNLFRTIDND